MLGWDGTYFRAAHVDADGDLQVDVLPLGLERIWVDAFAIGVAANSTTFLTGTVPAQGHLVDVFLRVQGAAIAAGNGLITMRFDGAYNCRFKLNDAVYLSGGVVGNYADIDVIAWDDVMFDYWVHWKTDVPFFESYLISVQNLDMVNAATFTVRVILLRHP